MTSGGSSRPMLAWMTIPAFFLLVALIALGTSTEQREDFQDRLERQQDRSESGREDRGGDRREGLGDGIAGGDLDSLDPGDRNRFGEPYDGDLEGADVTFVTENGDVVVTVDDGQVLLRPADQSGGDAIALDPDDLYGVRLGEDGRLEVVPVDGIRPDDTVVVPADGKGFDLLRPGGERVEFRTDGRHGGLTATEIGPDGEAVELVPDPDGTVTLSDGTRVGPVDIAPAPNIVERVIDRTSQLPWPLLVAAVVLLAAGSVALALYLHRRRPTDTFESPQFAGPDVPDDRFEAFLAGLASDPDPSRAVRVGFSVAERGLGGVPPRRHDETPFEWQQRADQARPDLGQTIATVCDLFARVRFAPGGATDHDRHRLIDALRMLHQLDRRQPSPPTDPDPDRGPLAV